MTTSQRGRPIILVSGYRFSKHQVRGAKFHWKCSTHAKLGCRAILHTLEDMSIVKCHNVHNHYPQTVPSYRSCYVQVTKQE
ncbi:Modifier of mdg4 [Operophtera brumata]|uniref:Modifier of mdg4 n=1 Tax=Operophtera brumata TaxID=104452 RepID=A0A0L7LBR8_OPEBR|nr:Modifier of mdg4 [Operophtera brumata]